jgi:hypothetical protein
LRTASLPAPDITCRPPEFVEAKHGCSALLISDWTCLQCGVLKYSAHIAPHIRQFKKSGKYLPLASIIHISPCSSAEQKFYHQSE